MRRIFIMSLALLLLVSGSCLAAEWNYSTSEGAIDTYYDVSSIVAYQDSTDKKRHLIGCWIRRDLPPSHAIKLSVKNHNPELRDAAYQMSYIRINREMTKLYTYEVIYFSEENVILKRNVLHGAPERIQQDSTLHQLAKDIKSQV